MAKDARRPTSPTGDTIATSKLRPREAGSEGPSPRGTRSTPIAAPSSEPARPRRHAEREKLDDALDAARWGLAPPPMTWASLPAPPPLEQASVASRTEMVRVLEALRVAAGEGWLRSVRVGSEGSSRRVDLVLRTRAGEAAISLVDEGDRVRVIAPSALAPAVERQLRDAGIVADVCSPTDSVR